MLSIGSLTNSPTSLFWLTVGILALTVAVVAIGIITLRLSTDRKKILLTVTSRSQILSVPDSFLDDLQIIYKGKQIQGDLYVTAIELANIGKSAIKSDDFDLKRPLQFALDVEIIKHLSTSQVPKSAPYPTITVDGNRFMLDPELIDKGEVISIALLTAGDPTRIETSFVPFDGDISIRDRKVTESKKERRRGVISQFALAALGMAVAIPLIWAVNDMSDKLQSYQHNPTILSVCFVLGADDSIENSLLGTIRTETAIIQGRHAYSGPDLEEYRKLLSTTEGVLENIDGEYSLGFFSAPAVKMDSLLQNVYPTIDEAMKSPSGSAPSRLIGQLAKIQKLSSSPEESPKAIWPTECNSGASRGSSIP